MFVQMKETEQYSELCQLFTENDYLASLKKALAGIQNNHSFALVGGAVVDIAEKREPNDYDFVGWSGNIINAFLKDGYSFVRETKSAVTLKKGSYVCQFLTKDLLDFDFVISQSRYFLLGRRSEVVIDRVSFETKTLIPTSFDSFGKALNAMSRIPHWRKKGYDIDDLTYQSLLHVIGSYTPIKS